MCVFECLVVLCARWDCLRRGEYEAECGEACARACLSGKELVVAAMAKSVRSKVKKRNRTALRKNAGLPVEKGKMAECTKNMKKMIAKQQGKAMFRS